MTDAAASRERAAARIEINAAVVKLRVAVGKFIVATAAVWLRLSVLCFGWNHIIAPATNVGHIGLLAAWAVQLTIQLVAPPPKEPELPIGWERIGSSIARSVVVLALFQIAVWLS